MDASFQVLESHSIPGQLRPQLWLFTVRYDGSRPACAYRSRSACSPLTSCCFERWELQFLQLQLACHSFHLQLQFLLS
ncbi:hypothetical protein VZT92_022912 [Zoarces viviparus]|uniref:Uncharacterized protein n=1 Tax=Zoarces viviparus TaxID=48416 RepID=A0AAW1E4K2_ZOAVI